MAKNEMDMLYSASEKAILDWRSKRKRYLKMVREHNAGHAIKLQARPVKDFVDELIWSAISKKKLLVQHRTKRGEDANHKQCAHYFAGTGEYKDHIARDSLDPLKVLRAVKYEKGREGATNEDRWFSYMHRRDKALEKIPDQQLTNKVFREAHASQLRSVLRPADLRKLVDKAYRTGLHPGTGKYNATWNQNTRYSVDGTENMIEEIIDYLDARAREGLWVCKWDSSPADNTPKSQQVCQNFLKGKCKKGDKCPRLHTREKRQASMVQPVANSGGGTQQQHKHDSSRERPLGDGNKRCPADAKGEKCQYGEKCYYAHRHTLNPRKDAKPLSPPKDHSDKICNACGKRGHIAWKCKGVKAHVEDLKEAIGYNGDPKWFADEANSKKSQQLFKAKQWFAVSAHKPMTKVPEDLVHGMKPLKEGQLPFKLEGDITDAGWCWLGWGEQRVHLRLGVDLGSTCSFCTTGVYDEILPMIKAGKLGAARLASEVPRVVADSWNGKKDDMKNWVQLVVTANNVQGVQTVCIGQFVTFCRKSEERVLVAGKDLAYCLGFELVPEQIKHQATRGIDPEVVLGDGAPGRTYVMSAAQKDKIKSNRRLTELQSRMFGDGLAYIGDAAFRQVGPMQWANDPVLRHSYITTAALHQAGSSANKLKYEGILSELAVQDYQALGDWMVDEIHPEAAGSVVGLVEVDVIRVVSEMRPFARLEKVRFRVIQSTQRRVVFGGDVMARLDAQEEDCPDPLQSDI